MLRLLLTAVRSSRNTQRTYGTTSNRRPPQQSDANLPSPAPGMHTIGFDLCDSAIADLHSKAMQTAQPRIRNAHDWLRLLNSATADLHSKAMQTACPAPGIHTISHCPCDLPTQGTPRRPAPFLPHRIEPHTRLDDRQRPDSRQRHLDRRMMRIIAHQPGTIRPLIDPV